MFQFAVFLSLLAFNQHAEPVEPNSCGRVALFSYLYLHLGHECEGGYSAICRELELSDNGTNLLELAVAANHFGLPSAVGRSDMGDLEKLRVPFIAHLNRYSFGSWVSDDQGTGHFVVVVEVSGGVVHILDPLSGKIVKYSSEKFEASWSGLLVGPTVKRSFADSIAILVWIGNFCLAGVLLVKQWNFRAAKAFRKVRRPSHSVTN